MKHPKRLMIHSKVWDVTNVMNLTPQGSVGEDELAYVIEGWGTGDVITEVVTDGDLADAIADGTASIIE